MRRSLRWAAGGLAIVAAALALALAPGTAAAAAAQTWPPFVLVAGLLLIGLVANEDGVFAAAASLLQGVGGGTMPLYLAAMLLVAVVTALLNLDTSVAFLTPVLVLAARRRGLDERRFLYGCVYMSNAASLLLPGSNLTNLLVLSGEHISGSGFAARMVAPWLAAIVVTTVVVALTCPLAQERASAAGSRAAAANPKVHRARRRLALSSAAIAVAAVLLLALSEPALPLLGVGLALTAVRLQQRRLSLARIRSGVDMLSLAGVFLAALSLGTLARVWSYPAHLMAGAGEVTTAAVASALAVAVNNLPAAVLLGSRMPAHPRALLLGLNIGPNLAVTGSLSALIWWQAARAVGARPSALRYSLVGVILVPLTLAAALGAAHLPC